jgi:hypothetical protein
MVSAPYSHSLYLGDIHSLMQSIGTKQMAQKPSSTSFTGSNGQTTLKKLNLLGDKNIVLEVLGERYCTVRAYRQMHSAGAFKVWVHLVANPVLGSTVSISSRPNNLL